MHKLSVDHPRPGKSPYTVDLAGRNDTPSTRLEAIRR